MTVSGHHGAHFNSRVPELPDIDALDLGFPPGISPACGQMPPSMEPWVADQGNRALVVTTDYRDLLGAPKVFTEVNFILSFSMQTGVR